MKEEYDFSNGERGKFYNKNATFNLPIIVNALLFKDKELMRIR